MLSSGGVLRDVVYGVPGCVAAWLLAQGPCVMRGAEGVCDTVVHRCEGVHSCGVVEVVASQRMRSLAAQGACVLTVLCANMWVIDGALVGP